MEHEITGHSRKVYKLWKNNDLSPWKKAKEIAIEILIIVFAVSLAAFLERQREHSNEQKQVKEFLIGIKSDLQNDIREMEGDKLSYVGASAVFSYLTSLSPGEKANGDSLSKYSNFLLSKTGLLVNDGRYQGFKSSGKISTIENKELQDDILDLYQEDIPSILASTNNYSARKEVLFDYIFDTVKRLPNGSTNIIDVLATDKVYNLSTMLSSTKETLDRYQLAINKSKKIIAAIDREYQ